MKDKNIVILEIPYNESEDDITGAKIVYMYNHKKASEFDKVLKFLQKRVNPYKKVRYEVLFLAREEKGRYFKTVNSDEEEVIDIYRHLSGQNKCLIRRTVKNLDTYYSNDPYLQGYFWCDTPAKATLYTHEESDLLNSFRALNEQQRRELLNAMHIQISNYQINSYGMKLSKDEKKLIDDYRNLNSACKKLVKSTITNLNIATTQQKHSNPIKP